MKDIKEILASDRFIEDKNKGFTFDGWNCEVKNGNSTD